MAERVEWEYLILRLDGDFVGACNTAGAQGWEIVFPVSPPPSPGATNSPHVLAKRVKQLVTVAQPEEVRRLVLLGNSLANGNGGNGATHDG